MSDVNVNLGELLQASNSIKTAIGSIESTKSSISRKYQQLSNEWKDKKYKELGEIIQECNRALNSILKTLLQGEKYLALLVKSLQEYENTNFSANGISANNGTSDSNYSSTGLNHTNQTSENYVLMVEMSQSLIIRLLKIQVEFVIREVHIQQDHSKLVAVVRAPPL